MSNLYYYAAAIKNWITADQVEMVVDLGFGVHKVVKLKVFGFEPPPLRKSNKIVVLGQKALTAANKLLPQGSIVTIQSAKSPKRSDKHRFQIQMWFKSQTDAIVNYTDEMKKLGHEK